MESLPPPQAWADVPINASNFPDTNFRNLITALADKDGNGILSDTEIANTTSIDVSNSRISSLEGIKNFTNLQSFSCYDNYVREVDLSGLSNLNNVIFFYGADNSYLESLDLSGTSITLSNLFQYGTEFSAPNLTSLDISDCQLSSLDGIKNFTGLQFLICYSNYFKDIDLSGMSKFNRIAFARQYINGGSNTADLSNTYLETLNLSGTAITVLRFAPYDAPYGLTYYGGSGYTPNLRSLNLAGCTSLKTFDGFSSTSTGSLVSLDVSGCTSLATLGCHSARKLEEINLSGCIGLTRLDLQSSYRDFSALDLSVCVELQNLNLNGNNLTKLDVSNNTKLTALSVYNNKLKGLDVSNNTKLQNLSCHRNELIELDLSKNTELRRLSCYNNSIKALDLSKTNINCADTSHYLRCYENQITVLDFKDGVSIDNSKYFLCSSQDIPAQPVVAVSNGTYK